MLLNRQMEIINHDHTTRANKKTNIFVFRQRSSHRYSMGNAYSLIIGRLCTLATRTTQSVPGFTGTILPNPQLDEETSFCLINTDVQMPDSPWYSITYFVVGVYAISADDSGARSLPDPMQEALRLVTNA